MATDAVSGASCVLIGFLLFPDLILRVTGWSVHTENSSHRIQVVDNDPEFLVGVRGLPKPICFHLESPENDVIRLLQDPVSGILVNARVFHDLLTNKSYLGTILVKGDEVRVLAKQDMILVNEVKYEWLGMKKLDVKGHTVVVGGDMVAVAFRQKNITLIVRRHFVTKKTDEDPHGNQKHGDRGGGEEGKNSAEGDKIVSYNENRGDSPPVVSLRTRRKTKEDDKLSYRLPDNTDKNNVKISTDSDNTKSSETTKTTDNTAGNHDSIVVVKRSARDGHGSSPHRHKHHQGRRHKKSQFRPEEGARFQRISAPMDQDNSRVQTHMPMGEQAGVVYLGVYISDSRDFSNRTHGLLGQFLFKRVKIEKFNYKKGRTKARFIINNDPTRKTLALLVLRRNAALNTTRACWRVRHKGRDVIDGSYQDYIVPSMRYTLMMRLPPHAPL